MSAIVLRDLQPQEFAAYRAYFVEDYGREIAINYSRPLEEACAQAAEELDESFPGGAPSADNHLMCIEQVAVAGSLLLGYLWYTVQSERQEAFIQDFFVFEQHRGKGYGKASMANLEASLYSDGVGHIKLRVAHNNQRALKLYRELGFAITGMSMAKRLGQ